MPAAPPDGKHFNWLPVIITGVAVLLLIIIGIVVLLTIKPKLPEITSFSANPTNIEAGQSATLSWSVKNALSVEILTDQNTVSVELAGNKQVQPVQTTEYKLIAKGKKGKEITKSLIIDVKDIKPPELDMIISPSKPTSEENVIFTATVKDPEGLSKLQIFVNGIKVEECTGSPCKYMGGPFNTFNERVVKYEANAYDKAGNKASTDSKTLVIGNLPASYSYGSGQTKPGATDWKPYGDGKTGIYVDVDTSSAGFTKPPVYFTSLGGISNHWATTGGTSIYNVTEKGFRIYLRFWNGQDVVTPQIANANQWYIQWVGIAPGSPCGQTKPDATAWMPYEGGKTGIYVDVDTSSAGFTKPPVYFTSLGGISNHWATTGGTSIYNATEKGFRIYLRFWNGQDVVTPQIANANQWYIQWVGIL